MKIYVGDSGTKIEVDTKQDLTSATTTNIVVKKPDGTNVTWNGTVDPANPTVINYITTSTDFDIPGTYICQAQVTLPGWSGRGDTFFINVNDVFS